MKKFLSEFIFTKRIYSELKTKKEKRAYQLAISGEKVFINRSRSLQKLCIVLAGYKPFCYEIVFNRLKRYIPIDIDVCIVSSGLFSETLKNLAEVNQWSYLSTTRNCVTLAQNIAIGLHERAEYIYKMDEDIFLTENCFQTLYNTYDYVKHNGDYQTGFIAPLIPVNGYGHKRILFKLEMEEIYSTKFEPSMYASGPERMIENCGGVAAFFWGEGGTIPLLDDLNRKFQQDQLSYSICPVRFSIGFILFTRQLWSEMGMFRVEKGGTGMGLDEEQICCYCMNKSRVIIVAENTVVGHLAFGKQNEEMKQYFMKHKSIFEVK